MAMHGNRNKLRKLILAASFAAILELALNYDINVASANPPEILKRTVWFSIPLVMGAAVALGLATSRTRGEQRDVPAEKPEVLARMNRQRMLERVKQCLREELSRSLRQVAPIELSCRVTSSATGEAHPYRESSAKIPAEEVATANRVIKSFVANRGSLLVTGRPGVGKTILMMRLAVDLCESVGSDAEEIPVYLNLASFAKGPWSDLAEWLVAQVNKIYRASVEAAQNWVEGEQLILLLDGLDEMHAKEMAACVKAINHFRQEHGLVPIAVCVRSNEYLKLSEQLDLAVVAEIIPPSHDEADEYLRNLNTPAAEAVRLVDHKDKNWWSFIRTPLALGMISRIVEDNPDAALVSQGNITSRRAHVVNAYIDTMLNRRSSRVRAYSGDSLKGWLAWLASTMTSQGCSDVVLDRLDPDWVGDEGKARVIRGTPMLGAMMIMPLAIGQIAVLGSLLPARYWPDAVGRVILFDMLANSISTKIIAHYNPYHEGPIEPVEKLSWSWKTARGSILVSILCGAAMGLLPAVVPTGVHGQGTWKYMLGHLDPSGAVVGVVILLCSAMMTATVPQLDSHRIYPKEGLDRSLRFANQASALSTIGIMLLVAAIQFAFGEFMLGVITAALAGVVWGIGSWFVLGGAPYVQYRRICRALYKAGHTPKRIDAMLDHASERLIMVQAGASYRFIHRYVQDELTAEL
jgi:hypothetical protein